MWKTGTLRRIDIDSDGWRVTGHGSGVGSTLSQVAGTSQRRLGGMVGGKMAMVVAEGPGCWVADPALVTSTVDSGITKVEQPIANCLGPQKVSGTDWALTSHCDASLGQISILLVSRSQCAFSTTRKVAPPEVRLLLAPLYCLCYENGFFLFRAARARRYATADVSGPN